VFIDAFLTKKKWDGSPIFDEFDSPNLKGIKQIHYIMERIFAMYGTINEEFGNFDSLDSDYAQRRMKMLEQLSTAERMIRKLIPIYIGPGDNKMIRLSRSLRNLGASYKSEIRKASVQKKAKPDMLKSWEKEYMRKLGLIQKKIEKEQGKRSSKSERRSLRRSN
jgi:hypothetical protein